MAAERFGGGLFDTVYDDTPHIKLHNPVCEKCHMKKSFQHCVERVQCVGWDCDKCIVMIKGIDFDALLRRVDELERWILRYELKHHMIDSVAKLIVDKL